MQYVYSLSSQFIDFLFDLFRSKRIIFELAKNDFRNRFLGSYLGLAWALIHPVATILVLALVFGIAFSGNLQEGTPFLLWLVPGIIVWFFFSESWGGATSSVVEYNYLVKKVVFRVSMLPMVKLLSALPIHIMLIILTTLLYIAYGEYPSIYIIQVVYYLLAQLFFLFGLSWLTAALFIFTRDIGHVITVVLGFGFWLSPIIWSLEMIPSSYRVYIMLNPLVYVISGYRDSFVGSIWFWDKPLYTLYFWLVSFTLFIIGALFFAKLRPHFADII